MKKSLLFAVSTQTDADLRLYINKNWRNSKLRQFYYANAIY